LTACDLPPVQWGLPAAEKSIVRGRSDASSEASTAAFTIETLFTGQ
jgi:hypothetical protein